MAMLTRIPAWALMALALALMLLAPFCVGLAAYLNLADKDLLASVGVSGFLIGVGVMAWGIERMRSS